MGYDQSTCDDHQSARDNKIPWEDLHWRCLGGAMQCSCPYWIQCGSFGSFMYVFMYRIKVHMLMWDKISKIPGSTTPKTIEPIITPLKWVEVEAAGQVRMQIEIIEGCQNINVFLNNSCRHFLIYSFRPLVHFVMSLLSIYIYCSNWRGQQANNGERGNGGIQFSHSDGYHNTVIHQEDCS